MDAALALVLRVPVVQDIKRQLFKLAAHHETARLARLRCYDCADGALLHFRMQSPTTPVVVPHLAPAAP
jgi:hypothetical protein